jgi:alanyl-tRNA synthetase
VGDTGFIRWAGGQARVTDTKKQAGVFIHMAEVTEGALRPGTPVKLEVDHARRSAIRANHSATHLLHEALRGRLGAHVAQKGSLNAPDRLRFDFSHNAALSPADLAAVEAEVNAFIRQDSPVETRLMTPDAARAIGALALFGEKYGDEVRVVAMGVRAGSGKGADGNTWSLELCGGTHVARTGEIGACVILSDSAISAGVRRIEALTGQAALDHLRAQEARLAEVAALLKAPVADVVERVRALVEERRGLAAEVARLRRELAMGGGGAAFQPRVVAGIPFVAEVVRGVAGKDLPAMIDAVKDRLGSGAVVLIADTGGKPAVAAGVTADLTARLSAVDLLRAAVAALGGKGGGGRADLAQGGGADIAAAPQALRAAEAVVAALG